VQGIILNANPKEVEVSKDYISNQTVELRSPNGSANTYQLLAGMTVAARHGLENDKSLDVAKNKELNLAQLSNSCYDAGKMLLKDREIYKKNDVFPSSMLDDLANDLMSLKDQHLSENLFADGDALQALVDRH
jgi:glutamine synthetase